MNEHIQKDKAFLAVLNHNMRNIDDIIDKLET